MKVYDTVWGEIPQNDWPRNGEICVFRDPQNRCGPDTWATSVFWKNPSDPSDASLINAPHHDVVGRGLFWHKECAVIFAQALEASNVI